MNEVAYNQRYIVINASGNKRYWPDSLNRADQDDAPAQKYIHDALEQATDPAHAKLGLPTVADILAASALDEDLASEWATLSENTPDQRIWTTNRFSKFKRLVDERRCRLYRHLFESLGFNIFVDGAE